MKTLKSVEDLIDLLASEALARDQLQIGSEHSRKLLRDVIDTLAKAHFEEPRLLSGVFALDQIKVFLKGEKSVVRFVKRPEVWAHGTSPELALGKLVSNYPESFGVSLSHQAVGKRRLRTEAEIESKIADDLAYARREALRATLKEDMASLVGASPDVAAEVLRLQEDATPEPPKEKNILKTIMEAFGLA